MIKRVMLSFLLLHAGCAFSAQPKSQAEASLTKQTIAGALAQASNALAQVSNGSAAQSIQQAQNGIAAAQCALKNGGTTPTSPHPYVDMSFPPPVDSFSLDSNAQAQNASIEKCDGEEVFSTEFKTPKGKGSRRCTKCEMTHKHLED